MRGGAGDRGWGDLSTLTKFTIWRPDVPKSPLERTIPELLQKIIILLPFSISNELDSERLRNFRGETEIVRNLKVLVDFEVRT
jgi:hypothetical protein